MLLRAFRHALEELSLPGRIVGTDITESAPGMHVVDHGEIVPRVRTMHYIPRLKELVEAHKIRLLIPLTDLDLRTLSRHAGSFGELGCTVMIAPPGVVDTCRDKLKFNNLIRKAGLRQIHGQDLRSFRKAPFYPCFVKPVHGSAAIGSRPVRNSQELRAHVATYGSQLMLQEVIHGQEFTIDVFRRRDGVVCAAVPRQRLSIRCGEVEKSLTTNDPELIEAALKLVEQMPGMWGVLNTQCRRPPGEEPYFFEANLRFGGGVPLTLAAGVDLPKLVIMDLLGQNVEPAVGEFTDNLLMMRYDEAIFTRVDHAAKLAGHREPLKR